MNNDELRKQALEIARAQAGVRSMTAAEIAAYVSELVKELDGTVNADESTGPNIDPKKSVGEGSVICLECGKKYKVLSIRHLRLHGMTAKEYKAKWGLKKGTPLIAKGLVRRRRKKMQEMRLWERRGNYRGTHELSR